MPKRLAFWGYAGQALIWMHESNQDRSMIIGEGLPVFYNGCAVGFFGCCSGSPDQETGKWPRLALTNSLRTNLKGVTLNQTTGIVVFLSVPGKRRQPLTGRPKSVPPAWDRLLQTGNRVQSWKQTRKSVIYTRIVFSPLGSQAQEAGPGFGRLH
jgi:hypothetical protein